jgi:hypothetical protein
MKGPPGSHRSGNVRFVGSRLTTGNFNFHYSQVANISAGMLWPGGQALPMFSPSFSVLDKILVQELIADELINLFVFQRPVKNGTGLSRFLVAAPMVDFLKTASWLGEWLIAFRSSFHGLWFASERTHVNLFSRTGFYRERRADGK